MYEKQMVKLIIFQNYDIFNPLICYFIIPTITDEIIDAVESRFWTLQLINK